MKSIFTFFIALLFSPLVMLAQINGDMLLQEGTRWTEALMDVYLSMRSSIEYEIKGDSMLNGYLYKKVYADGNFYTLLREDNERKVYYRYVDPDTKQEQEVLLYTFGIWNTGDSIAYAAPFLHNFKGHSEIYTVKDTIREGDITPIRLKDGKDYKIYRKQIIEGIGDIVQGPFGMLQIQFDNGTYWELLSFSTKDQTLYEVSLENFQTHLVTEGVHWVERSSVEEDPETPDPASQSYELAHFRIAGDTLINEKTYKKVYCNDYYYMGLREEDTFNVWRTVENGECLLYTFDWKAPLGRFTNDQGEDFKLPAGSTERTGIAGGEYITCKVPYNPDPSADPFRTHNKDIRLILNIGLTSGIFSHIQPGRKCLCFNDLVCFYNGDKLIYQNPVFTGQGEVLSIDAPQAEGNLSVLVSGNEVVFTLKNISGKETVRLIVYTSDGLKIGTYSMQTGSVMLSNLPGGVYFYRLNNQEGHMQTGKFYITE